MTEIKLESGQILDNFTAVSIAEGFCGGEDASMEDQLRAWSYIGKNGLHYSLQGWFGRTLHSLVENGVLDGEYNVNWDRVEEIKNG
jgi:hypothetical protein